MEKMCSFNFWNSAISKYFNFYEFFFFYLYKSIANDPSFQSVCVSTFALLCETRNVFPLCNLEEHALAFLPSFKTQRR